MRGTVRHPLLRDGVVAFLALFAIGAVEFALRTDPALVRPDADFIEVSLIVGGIQGLLGVAGFVLIALLLKIAGRIRPGIRPDFALYLMGGLTLFAYTGYAVNTTWLHGLPMRHPASIAATLLLLALCLFFARLLYSARRGGRKRSAPGGPGGNIATIARALVPFLGLLALAPACGRAAPGPSAGRAAPDSGEATSAAAGTVPRGAGSSAMNVLLITVDTLRPDHLGCYGHAGIHTPTIDALARDGVLFENVVTSVPITLPSHASIMTGLYPPAHGIRYNGAFSLPDSVETLAETLRGVGFATGAVVGSYALDSSFGIDQGFDTYDDHYPSGNLLKFRYPTLWPSLSRLLLSQVLVRLLPLDVIFSEPQRRADAVTGRALHWIDDHVGVRFFLWLHYFDPHAPYDAPRRDGTLPATGVPDPGLVTRGPPYRYWWGEIGSLEEVYGRYDAEIEYTDRWLGEVMAALERTGMREHTLIVLTADHGESLWEHGLAGHGNSVFESEIRVPLIVCGPAGLPRGLRIERPVETIDIFPTILEILGIPPRNTVQGRSLVDLIDGESGPEPRAAFCETLWPSSPERRRKGIRVDGWKYVTDPAGSPGALYDLASDPHEVRDVSAEHPGIAHALAGRLEALRTRLGDSSGALPEMSDEVKARLKALGYVR